jgi:hypothetical protein
MQTNNSKNAWPTFDTDRLKQSPATTSLLDDISIVLEYANIPWFIK